jgi:hypothetical protein
MCVKIRAYLIVCLKMGNPKIVPVGIFTGDKRGM